MFKNSPSEMKPEVEKLRGFFRGVIEDNEDPLKMGRCRIRVFGLHTKKTIKTETDGIPTNELPWFEPCLPIIEGSISGFGMWSVPVQGSHVMVFFENENPQLGRYFASLPGIPSEKSSINDATLTDGFKDPDNQYPVTNRIGESDYHRLSRGISSQTLVTTKNSNRDTNVQKAYGGTWSEPQSPYNARYPHNFVFTTHGGITIELDSTPGSKRFHIYHPSNTYIEVDNNGVMVIRNNDNKYVITLGDNNKHVYGNDNQTVDNNKTVKVKGNEDTEIAGNERKKVEGNVSIQVTGTADVTVTGDVTVQGGNDITVQSGNKIHLNP